MSHSNPCILTCNARLRLARRRLTALLAASLILQAGCAGTAPAQAVSEKTGPYYADAQICRAKNPAKALPPGADPAAAVDATGYLRCMKGMGYQQDARTDPLLVALKKCQQQGTPTVSASGATSMKPPTPAMVRQCLKLRGFPSAGQPPEPVQTATPPAETAKTATPSAAAATQTKSKTKAKNKARGVQEGSQEGIQTIYIPRRSTTPP